MHNYVHKLLLTREQQLICLRENANEQELVDNGDGWQEEFDTIQAILHPGESINTIALMFQDNPSQEAFQVLLNSIHTHFGLDKQELRFMFDLIVGADFHDYLFG